MFSLGSISRRFFAVLAVMPFGCTIASELKTEIHPEILNLEITLDVSSRDEFGNYLINKRFDQAGVSYAKRDVDW